MNKSKIKLIIAYMLLTILIIYSVSAHQKMVKFYHKNIDETRNLIVSYNTYLNRLNLLDQSEDIKSTILGYTRTLYARIEVHISNSTPLQTDETNEFDYYINDLYEMLFKAVEENDTEKYEIVKEQMLNLVNELNNLSNLIREKRIMKIPFIGEFAMRNELVNTIKLIIDKNK